jgi:hypothetical protein
MIDDTAATQTAALAATASPFPGAAAANVDRSLLDRFAQLSLAERLRAAAGAGPPR